MPVGSKTLAADPELDCGPSTIRNELALLEEHGLLAHPHTSRRPRARPTRATASSSTACSPSGRPAGDPAALELAARPPRGRRGDARDDRGAQPGHEPARGRHRAADRDRRRSATSRSCTLQPQVLMVVIITSTGGVSKRIFTFERPVDPGLAAWASAYLNEQLVGLGLGARMLARRLADPTLPPTERAFLDALTPAFTELADTAEDTLYVDGAARLIAEHRLQDLAQINELMTMLERRVELLGVLRQALGARDVLVRIGAEHERPRAALARRWSPSSYGLPARSARHRVAHRARCAWTTARRSSPCARPRTSCRATSRPSTTRPDARPTPTSCSASRGTPTRPRSRRPSASSRASCTPTSTSEPDAEDALQGGRRGLRDPQRPRAPRDLRPLRLRGAARRRLPPTDFGAFGGLVGHPRRVLRRRGGGGGIFGGGGRGGPGAGRRRRRARSRSTSPTSCTGTTVEVTFEAVARCSTLQRQRRRARHADPHLRALRRRRARCRASAARRSARSCARSSATSATATAASPSSRARRATGRGRTVERADAERRHPGGHRGRPAHPPHRPRPRRRRRARRPATSTSLVRVREDERFVRDGDDLVTVLDVPAPLAALGDTFEVETLDGAGRGRGARRARSPARCSSLRGEGLPTLRRGRRGDLRVVVNVVIPRRLDREQQRAAAQQLAESLDGEHLGDGDESVLGKLKRLLARRDPPRAARPARGRRGRAGRAARARARAGWRRSTSATASSTRSTAPPGELPALPDLEAAAGDALVEVVTTEVADDWAERWKAFHQPVEVGPLRVRPPWEPPRAEARSTSSSTRPGVRHRRAPHDAAVPRAAARPRARRRRSSTSAAARRAGDRRRAAGLGAGARRRLRPARRRGDRARTRASTACERRRPSACDLREQAAPAAPTVAANLLRPLLLALRFDEPPEHADRQRPAARRGRRGRAPRSQRRTASSRRGGSARASGPRCSAAVAR